MTALRAQSVSASSALPKQPSLELVKPNPVFSSVLPVRLAFWSVGILLASAQAWIGRYEVSADSISYLDMSDGLQRGSDWHLMINGMYSQLYPFLLGIFRRIFSISPGNEIPYSHLLGVVFFVFAFACFEFFLIGAAGKIRPPNQGSGENRMALAFPRWAFLSVAYSIFLWSAIRHIELTIPRADMLLSGFIYLTVGLILRMQGRPARWRSYISFGLVLGVGILAKEAMLPLGFLALASTLFLVENWRPAVKMAAAALAIMVLIGCFYFVPLSLQRGRLTLGDAGKCVYITNVDQAMPHWYLQDPGSAKGSFLHPPKKIFSDPPAYAFAVPAAVTEPLRFDQSYWMAGVKPHFVLGRELTAIKTNVRTFAKLFLELGVVLGTLIVLAFLGRRQIKVSLLRAWPAWLIGAAGCMIYVVIWVEPRYVTAFLTLVLIGLLVGLPVPVAVGRRIAQLIVVATIALLLVPVALHVYRAPRARGNVSLEAAQALENLGVKPGDPIARISSGSADLVVERILRSQIIAEVDRARVAEFWNASLATQESLLREFATQGAKVVIATSPHLTAENQPEWTRLGTTPYWVWRPANPAPGRFASMPALPSPTRAARRSTLFTGTSTGASWHQLFRRIPPTFTRNIGRPHRTLLSKALKRIWTGTTMFGWRPLAAATSSA
jgi:hypothetical protein